MPTVLRIGAFRCYFFSHEPNEPPHVHVDRGDATMKLWLETPEVARSRGFRAHELNWHNRHGRRQSGESAGGVA